MIRELQGFFVQGLGFISYTHFISDGVGAVKVRLNGGYSGTVPTVYKGSPVHGRRCIVLGNSPPLRILVTVKPCIIITIVPVSGEAVSSARCAVVRPVSRGI